jgi:site-specific DNA recombinase
LSSRIDIGDTLAPLDLDAHALDAALRNAFALSERMLAMPHVELISLLRDIVEQITVAADRIEIRLSRAKVAAFAVRNQLLLGSDDSIEAMSGRLGMNKGRITSLVRLSYLGPEIVRARLAGSQSNALTPSRLLRLSKNLPHDWKEQRCFLGFPT